MTSILALDLSINRTGWAALEAGPVLRETGAFDLPARRTSEGRAEWNTRRFVRLLCEVTGLLEHLGPEMVAYEWQPRPFHRAWAGQRITAGSEFNAMSGLALAEGMLIAIMAAKPFRLEAVSRMDAKRAATSWREKGAMGDPNASKAKVRSWLANRYAWDLSGKGDDEVDAIAVGLGALIEPGAPARPGRAAPAVVELLGRNRGRGR